MIEYDEIGPPPGMPGVTNRRNPASVTSPGTFRAAWEVSEHEQRQRAARRARLRTWVKRGTVVLLVGAVAFAAYPRAHTWFVARAVAADLRGYVRGRGVTYAPAGEGYSVRFPKAPAAAALPLAGSTLGALIVTHTAVAVAPDYRIVVWDAELPGGVLAKGPFGALRDPKIGGTGALQAAHRETIAGETAYVGTIAAGGAGPARVAVVAHAGRLFVLRVQAGSAGTVFAALVHSFRFTR